MNDIIPTVVAEPTTLDHFILGLDDEGNEVKLKLNELGELEHIQDIDDKEETVTVH